MLKKLLKVIELFKARISLSIALCGISGVLVMPEPHLGYFDFTILVISIFLSSASVSAYNQYYERDLDIMMQRTRERPFATGFFKPNLLWPLFFLSILIFSILLAANFLNFYSAFYIFLGAFFYCVVYTILLKRRNITNIIIGGLAGSFAVLAGAAAVDPNLSGSSIILAVVLFLWTPPHFWSLAIAIKEDYKKAGIPMLPNLISLKKSSWIILSHTILLVIVSFLPFFFNMGILYLIGAIAGGTYFIWRSILLVFNTSKSNAMANFFASFIQLGLLLVVCIIEGVINYF